MSKPNIYASPQVEPMLGYPASSWESDPDLLAKIVHPDDRDRVLAEAKRVRSTGEPLHDEYRYLTPDDRDFMAVFSKVPGPVTVPFK